MDWIKGIGILFAIEGVAMIIGYGFGLGLKWSGVKLGGTVTVNVERKS